MSMICERLASWTSLLVVIIGLKSICRKCFGKDLIIVECVGFKNYCDFARGIPNVAHGRIPFAFVARERAKAIARPVPGKRKRKQKY